MKRIMGHYRAGRGAYFDHPAGPQPGIEDPECKSELLAAELSARGGQQQRLLKFSFLTTGKKI